MDLLRHMTTFVRIAESGSISKAARSLRLSVAMTSRQLRALEAELGVTLVRRTTRQLALTDAGTRFLERARVALSSAAEARESVRRRREPVGRVAVSLPVSFALPAVAPVYWSLLARHPRLELDLRFEDRVADLIGEAIDVAVRATSTSVDSLDLVARRIARIDRVLCASPSFLARSPSIKSIEDLSKVSCVIQGDARHWSFDTADGPRVVSVNTRLRTNSVVALREAAIAGVGVARAPYWLVSEELERGRLVSLELDATLSPVELQAVYHKGAVGSPSVDAFVSHFVSELPKTIPLQRR